MYESIMKISGVPVTSRIKQVKQPRGGYINPKAFKSQSLGDGMDTLNPDENVHASLIGLAVDYMTRFMSGTPATEAFKISIKGASIIHEESKATRLIAGVNGLDDDSVVNAVKLSGFDVVYRSGLMGYKSVDEINPDAPTIRNVRTMIERSLHFLDAYGPKVLDGFTFDGGYTCIVSEGDGDFTTSDTLWDFKGARKPVSKENTLQLLMYWRMGLHSIHPEFKNIRYLGVYNPRLNIVSRIAVADIPSDIISQVEHEVIGYNA